MKKLILCALVALTGCASSYDKFYSPVATDAQLSQLALLQDGKNPEIMRVTDLPAAIHTARQKGYIPFGESSFNGPVESESALISQAKKVRATLVIAKSSFAETKTINSSYSVPTTTTTFNQGMVSNGAGAASYSGTSTTYGTKEVPFSMIVERYHQNAVYFAKSKAPAKFGFWVVDLTPELKRKVESNFGVLVDVVQEGSVAYNGNILEGDILLALNDVPLPSEAGSAPVMRDARPINGKYTFRIFRNGQIRTIDVPAR